MISRRKPRAAEPEVSTERTAEHARPRRNATKGVERGVRARSRATSPKAAAGMGARSKPGIEIVIPGNKQHLRIEHVVFDYNGTLALDAGLVRGVATRLKQLAKRVHIAVMTADTYGTARRVLANLPVEVHIVHTGIEKRRLVEALGPKVVAAIGNGNNDVPMLKVAALGMVVMGDEGTSVEAINTATVVTRDIAIALDLLLKPDRLGGTLRR